MKLLEICSWSNLAPFQPKYCKGRKFTRLNRKWNSLNFKPNCVFRAVLNWTVKTFQNNCYYFVPSPTCFTWRGFSERAATWHRPGWDLVSISVVSSYSSQTGSTLCGLSVTSFLSLLRSIKFSHVRKPCGFPRLSCFHLQWLDMTWHKPAERQGAPPGVSPGQNKTILLGSCERDYPCETLSVSFHQKTV